MGKLKISSNLFLEVNELTRFRKLIEDDGYKLFCRYLTKSFGIAKNDDNTFFKVSQVGSSNKILINAGIAFDPNMNIIVLREDTEAQITNTGSKKWIILSYNSTNDEEGTVSISNQGVLSGTGTKFTEVLRGGQNFPTKVKFTSSKNTIEYEVSEVTSDTEAVLSGSFTAETGLKYQVVGTFTPGFQPDDDNKAIYEYDSCSISIIDSDDTPALADGEYVLASIDFKTSGMEITDERSPYIFNKEQETTAEGYSINENPFVALRSTKIKSDRILDLQFEWGYKVNKYELVNTAQYNIFSITSGESKYIPAKTNIPTNLFTNWKLLNRKNMVSVTIDRNEGNDLYIGVFDSDLITENADDFVIIPPYSEIEVEAKVSGTNYETDETNYYNVFSIENLRSRFTIPLEYLDTKITLKYRMKSSGATTLFQDFMTSQFDNIDGNSETLGESSFEVNIPVPVEKIRNYS